MVRATVTLADPCDTGTIWPQPAHMIQIHALAEPCGTGTINPSADVGNQPCVTCYG
jgi:hypothetical protein